MRRQGTMLILFLGNVVMHLYIVWYSDVGMFERFANNG